MFIGIQTFRFGLFYLKSKTSKSKGLDSNARRYGNEVKPMELWLLDYGPLKIYGKLRNGIITSISFKEVVNSIIIGGVNIRPGVDIS